MSGALRTVGMIAGAVALVATGVGAFAAAGSALAATAGSIASYATVAAGIANLGSQALAKPPPARGSVSDVNIAADAPTPYLMGEGYFGGVVRYDRGYGGTVDDVPNPYRFMAVVYSHGGPHQSVSPYVDFAPYTGGWYQGYLVTNTNLGQQPDDALIGFWSGIPGWGAASKLSGQAAVGWNFKFDKKGKRYGNGLPVLGAYGKWAKVYDPRKDSTFPGGSGAHRLGDESTYEWSASPALHAGTYAFGRYQNGKRVLGMGLPADAIEWAAIAAWANVCEANNWTMFGQVFEPGDRWANLKDICFAGGAEPIPGGVLSFKYHAPAIPLDTVTPADLVDGEHSVMAMASYRDRINTAVPKYRSPAHNWELVDAADEVNAAFLAEDGEEKRETWPFNFVTDKDQATELAAYRIWDSRELNPIVLTVMPRLRAYRPGECLRIELPDEGLSTDAIILTRKLDPFTGAVTLKLMGETPGKHAYCLGLTGIAPPTPSLLPTPEERDNVASSFYDSSGARRIVTKTVNFPLSSDDTTISVAAFTGTLDNGLEVSFPAATMTGLTAGETYVVFYDLVAETYSAVLSPATTASKDKTLAIIGEQQTSDGGVYADQEPPPPGYCVADDTPILLADGSEVPASAIKVDTILRTRHERTMAWGEWPVLAISFHDEAVFACQLEGANGPVTIRATARHRFLIDNRWICACEIGEPDGSARVAKITVADAHTYISNGVISHNVKAGDGGL